MQPRELFRFCPKCGGAVSPNSSPLKCAACGFTFYFNPTVAAAAFIADGAGKYAFIRRAKDPGKGKLTVAGGFIDIGETAEEGLVREIREELGLVVTDVQYLTSMTNSYFYRDVTYPVCDLMFHAVATNPEAAQALDGTASYEWAELAAIDPAEFAFPAVRKGWELLVGRSPRGEAGAESLPACRRPTEADA